MAISCAALMCHAPIVLPEIGRERAAECAATTQAMRELAAVVVAHRPDLVVLVSPHAPRRGALFGVVAAPQIAGGFERFGFDEPVLRLPGAPRAARDLRQAAERIGVECWTAPGSDLDHGAVVPLHFLVRAGWNGPTLVLALPYHGGESGEAMGEALRAAMQETGRRCAVIASGDMSHRLSPDAPAGFHPRAHEFDAAFVARLRSGDYRAACDPDPTLQALAAEDVVDSVRVAAAAVRFRADGLRLFSYEAPFGVGYCECLLFSDGSSSEPGPTSSDNDALEVGYRPPPLPSLLPEIAREAIRAERLGQPLVLPPLDAPWREPRAVFVTLRSQDGELRGCIGRTHPDCANLAEEIVDCARSAASHDPRCAPVRLTEIDELVIEVSVLSPPVPVASRDELDPQRFGVVVSFGAQRGVLLPGLAGVETVEEQLRIAVEKAGIARDAPFLIERFEVQKVCSKP